MLEDLSNLDMVDELSIIQGPYDVLMKIKGRGAKEVNTFIESLKMMDFAEVIKYPRVRTLKKKHETTRIDIEKLSPEERINSFAEVIRGYLTEEAIEEASRCLECKKPFCETGCPLGMPVSSYREDVDARGYLGLIANGQFEEAYRLILDTSPIPATLGRVCHHPCEDLCVLGHKGEPVAICRLKRFVADYMYEQEKHLAYTTRDIFQEFLNGAEKKKQRVAVIGSGPSGLQVSFDLARLGYNITIFEELDVLGGMLRWEIPDYRLPKYALQREINNILSLDIEARMNTRIEDIDHLFSEGYDAVFIGVGAPKPKSLGIPGEDLEGVYPGEDFLKDMNLGNNIDFADKKIVIVGGGNTALDSARTALRLGAKQVSIVYRRRRQQMPGHGHEISDAEAEGILLFFLASPLRLIGEDRLEMVECIRMKLVEADESGRRRPIPIEHSEFLIETDIFIPAIGRGTDIGWLNDSVDISEWGTIKVDDFNATSRAGVFAGGDVVNSASVVVEALADGKRAAQGIHKYLQQEL
jgi:glutamate synthase (NADPH/NADH) small chain